MPTAKHLNLIIAGVGGQGVNSLAKVLADALLQSNFHCQFTVHKGGAQSLGSVYAEFRISRNSEEKLTILGQGIPRAQLDCLISLDPWEALRHVNLAHEATTLWVEKSTQALFIERGLKQSDKKKIATPQSQLNALPLTVHWQDYQKNALQHYKTKKMANYLAGLDCLIALKNNKVQIEPALFDTLFFSKITKAKQA